MKRFFRTVAGKALLFFLTALFATVGLLGTVAALVMSANGYYESADMSRPLQQEYVENLVYEAASDLFLGSSISRDDSAAGYVVYQGDSELQFVLYNDEDVIVAQSEDYEEVASPETFWVGVLWNQAGYASDVFLSSSPYVDLLPTYYRVEAYVDAVQYPLWEQGMLWAYEHRILIPVFGALSLLFAIVCFIALMCVTARRPDDEGLYPGPFARFPSDLMLLLCGVVVFSSFIWLGEISYAHVEAAVGIAVCTLFDVVLLLACCMHIAALIKQKSLLSNLLCVAVVRFVIKLIRLFFHGIITIVKSLPMVWKTALLIAGISLLELILILIYHEDGAVLTSLWFLEKLIVVPAVLWFVISLRKLQKGGQALASGNLEYQVNTARMYLDLKEHGENLNHIADGMNRAVEERMKSERMKAELLTNVSHDIKTPLTSIINYTTLIGQTADDQEKTQEYAAVLLRQSERLKRLIEDLIEASKASTGNLSVELTPCDVGILLSQAAGEYEERLKDIGLELVLTTPEQPVHIQADGRRLWRVFDNLLNNIVKYAQPGTRVYLSLEEQGEETVIVFRNISRDPLNISADELMERFVRGDRSRSTEGNGLGLSIAQSLVELQNGTLALSIDGDLFRAEIRFRKS